MLDRPQHIPENPGSYRFLNSKDEVIYVGKALNLKNRVSQYFQNQSSLSDRIRQMVSEATRVEWIIVPTELDSLLLEHSFIQEFQPKYNVMLRDDKTYPYIAVTVKENWPRVFMTRSTKSKQTKYFGPYVKVTQARESIELIEKVIPLRSCNDKKFNFHSKEGKPCLLFHIKRCVGPCIGAITQDEYKCLVDDMLKVLGGNIESIEEATKKQMESFANDLDFERAAFWRDRLLNLSLVKEQQVVVGSKQDEIDILGLFKSNLQIGVHVLRVRSGRIVGSSSLSLDGGDDLSDEEISSQLIELIYEIKPKSVPAKEILVNAVPKDIEVINEWLIREKGSNVTIKVPKRGHKHKLLETANENAKSDIERQSIFRSKDVQARTKQLQDLMDGLNISSSLYRIECYDCSHLQGTNYVGSMIVFNDGLPAKNEYRRFKVSLPKNDDFGAIAEVLERRLRRLVKPSLLSEVPLTENEDGALKSKRSFERVPDLIVIDGGKGQLSSVGSVLKKLQLDIPVVSLAKKLEEVFVPNKSIPIVFPPGSDALFLLERVRDEAHRFAITFHRERRNKEMVQSVLDGIFGLSEVKRKKLLKEFGSVNSLRAMSFEQINAIDWLSDKIKLDLYEKLHS